MYIFSFGNVKILILEAVKVEERASGVGTTGRASGAGTTGQASGGTPQVNGAGTAGQANIIDAFGGRLGGYSRDRRVFSPHRDIFYLGDGCFYAHDKTEEEGKDTKTEKSNLVYFLS